MRTIEITTTQNVSIEYELAALRDRMVAFLIDSVIMWASIIILLIFVQIALPGQLSRYAVYIVIAPIFIFYTLLSEILANGQSWGKKAMGIKVVKINGTEGSVSDYLIRWTFRMVDIYLSLGSVATLMISSTEKAQRLGDIIANTAVIKVKPKSNLRLKDIMRISSLQNYVPHYPQVKQMSEAEMLIVKNVIDRVKKYPNTAHDEAVNSLVQILCERLNITEKIPDRITFLRTIINDYIVLTR